ncbi:MAG: phosphoglycerate transporter protein PgtP [Chlamydiia bacterium]|nr:phosphoglycerate transporter protein PgtP [Chlamydiia bacterium]
MKKIFRFFIPPEKRSDIAEQALVKKRYAYWRWRTFFGMYSGYAMFYLTRKSFNAAKPALMEGLGLTITDLGILGTAFSLAYGLSKFLSGVLGDRSNPRYFMGIGLIVTGVLNLIFGAASTIWVFLVLWALNGCFQGWGWPPCAKLLTHWYSQNERGRWWGLWNTSHNLGAFVIPVIVTWAIGAFSWRSGMYIPGIIAILGGLGVIYTLRDTPQSMGLPPIEKFRKDDPDGAPVDEKIKLSSKEILVKYVFKNVYIWLLAIAYFFIYFLREGVNEWMQMFFTQSCGFSLGQANVGLSFFEAGGFLGSLAAGWISDRIFNGNRGPVNVLFSMGILGMLAVLWMTPQGHVTFATFAMFLTGFMIFGPQMLIGMAAVERSHKNAAGTASGFVGWFAYLGSAAAGWPLSKIKQVAGWGPVFVALAGCAIVAILLLLPLWSKKRDPEYAEAI